MSSLPFSVDMETMEGHVPSTSEFIISAKTKRGRFPPNGLTGTSQQDMDTREDKSMNVIVHSEQAKSSAETLRDEMQKQCHSVSLLCVREPTDLKEKISLDSVTGLYMMVDPSLFELLFQRKVHRGLHSDVYDFMDELEEKNKCISLFNKMEKGDDRFRMLFYHLPKKCVKIVKQITVQGGKVKDMKKRSSKSIDSGIADLSLNENSKQKSGGAAADSGNKLGDGSSSDQRVETDSIKTGPGGDSREIHYSQKDAGLMSSPPEGLMASSGNAELYSEESPEGKAEVNLEDKEELELTDEESLSEDSEEEPQSNVDVQAVQIGHHQTMEVQWTGSQMVNASQEGWNNTLEVNIVPQASKSKVIVVFTTNPCDENLDNLLLKEFNDETELINVRVADLDGSNVKVSSGSVVMEIEVKPGVTIDKHYIEKLMNIIFSGKAGKVVPEKTKFDVDIQTKMVVPFDQLGKYLHLNPEKIHENCVSKEKYEEKVKEIQQLQSRLAQGILKNPMQDQVLQSALKNFISSVLTDFAFAMATEIPALPVSGSLRRQEATDREEERNPMVSVRRTSLEQENEVQGFSQRVDSGYNEITPRKGLFKKNKKKVPPPKKVAEVIPEPELEEENFYDDGEGEHDIYAVPEEEENAPKDPPPQRKKSPIPVPEESEATYEPPSISSSDVSEESGSDGRPPLPLPPRTGKDDKVQKATSPKPVVSPKPAAPSVKERKNLPLESPASPPKNGTEVFVFKDDDDVYADACSLRLSMYPWYHGDISREEGARRVQSIGKDGAFLMRTSKKHESQPYTLVLLYKDRVNNLKVRKRPDGQFALGEEKRNEIAFGSEEEIIDFHKKNAVTLTGCTPGETTLSECPDGREAS